MACEPKPLLGLTDLPLGCSQFALRGCELFAERFLFVLKHVKRDCAWVGEMVLDQPTSLIAQVGNDLACANQLTLAVAGQQSEHLDQLRFQSGNPFGVQLHLAEVVVRYVALDPASSQVRQLAAFSPVPGTADEVVVEAALASSALHEDQSGAAMRAENGAFQVVLMPPMPLAGDGMRGKPLLYLLEEFWRNQLRVEPLILDAFEADNADVKGVLKEAMQRGHLNWLRRELPGR